MATTLPKLTPPEIKEWVDSVEDFYPVSALSDLPKNANLEQIEEAFGTDRNTLMGIGEALMERARWDAWGSYQNRITYDEQ